MKRHIAPRKLQNCCDECHNPILKGHVYYTKRKVYEYGDEILGFTKRYCARCNYGNQDHAERYKRFKPNCHHPLTHEVWDYIPGEYVMQPDHDVCLICGEWLA